LRRTVSDKLKIAPEKLILFLKGEQLLGQHEITLAEKNIVHVVNTDHVKEGRINLHVKRLEGEKNLTHFEVEAGSLIG